MNTKKDYQGINVSCMIQMVNLLGMDMIAEGVETEEQAEFLLERGCCEMQGYYFFRPMPVQKFEMLETKI
ncbi:MAG: EAL domain-containing protein [Solobacterium sp.]|nr:EAL domain-containing protein [Solobacterium sp.]